VRKTALQVAIVVVDKRLAKIGIEGQTATPGQFAAFIRNELAQNAKVVKFAGIKVE
jgi:hypothetical protein